MKFKDFSIKSQLKIGFGIIVLLILFLSFVAWKMNDILTQQTRDIYYHSLVIRRALGALKTDVLSIQRDTKEIVLSGGKEDITSIIGNIETYRNDVQKQFEIIYNQYLGKKTDVDTVINNYLKWNSIREESMRLFRDSKLQEASERSRATGAGGRQADIFFKNLTKIDQSSSEISDKLIKEAENLNHRLKIELLISIGVVLSLTLMIIQILSRNIRMPLTELANSTKNFKEGKHHARSKYISQNEFGSLSDVFNQMADSIETELTLNTQSANLAGVMLSEDDAHEFCRNLISTLLEYTDSQMGAVYIMDESKNHFELLESIGIDAKTAHSFSISNLEGELGTSIALKKIQHITEIPEKAVFTYSTVSGKFRPLEIVTIPLQVNNEIIAMISLASIKKFPDISIRLLETVVNVLSARMDGVLSYRKVVDFSKKLEYQNRELESQKNELSAQANEMTQQNVELSIQKKQVDEANRLKTSFLSNMSHELRTPLNSVIALSGVLNRRLKDKVPTEEYSYLEVIERNGKQLLELINDILDLSRIESGREEINISRFNINLLINEIIDVVGPQARQKNITLRLIPGNNLPEIRSDYEKCRHILQNIIANAVKFTEKGGVNIETDSLNDAIKVSIVDTGIGIESDFLNHIFEEFRQAESSNSRKYGGTGLGLSIAKKYTEMLGGNIKIDSIRGKGSTFIVSLPTVFATSQEPEIEYENYQRPQYEERINSTGGKTILLVEDMEPVIIQLKDFLETKDYNIIVAHDGAEALEKIAQSIPDAMILDLMMPGVDGFEVLRQIRAEEKTSKIPVIVLTAKYITKRRTCLIKTRPHSSAYSKGQYQ